MNNTAFNKILLTLLFLLLLTPIVASFLLDLQEKKAEEILIKQEENNQKVIQKMREDVKLRIYLIGKFEPSEQEDFDIIPLKYNIAGYKMYLKKEALNAFSQMADLAIKDGVELNITSATRNFDYQKNLWNNKWDGITLVEGDDLSQSIQNEKERFEKILDYSAVPGTSRHHWGTEIDINSVTPKFFETEEGEKVYTWLNKNASLFGFCQTYNLKGSLRSTGYNEEKWHWSYLPLARKFTEDYKRLITDKNIVGFKGDEHVTSFDLINDYVLGINKECL